MAPEPDGPTAAELLAGEITADGRPAQVPLGDTTITVPPITAWPAPALDALQVGDYETWAELVLDDDNFDTWTAADPTVDQCVELLDGWTRTTGQHLGTVLRVADLIRRYPRQVEGDLWFHYQGLDLRDLWRPSGGPRRLTWRLLDVLIERLPGESATKTAIRDDMADEQIAEITATPQRGHGPWSHSDLLAADIIDLLKWVIYAIYAAQGGKPDRPKPYPRPGVGKVKPRRIGAPQMAYLQRLRTQHEALHGDTSGRNIIQFPGSDGAEAG